MNTKIFTTTFVLAAVSGSMVLFTGCQPEGEPMPPGVYIRPVEKDPERVDIPKQDTAADPLPADPGFAPAPTAEILPAPPPPPAPEVKKVPEGKKTPAVKKSTKRAPRKIAERKEALKYVVKKNDNLSRIAYKYGIKVSDLKKYNALKKDVIYPKQILMIPPTGKVTGEYSNLSSLKKSGKTKKIRKAAKAIPADGIHVVKARENYTTISRMYGITIGDMVSANPGVNSARLRIGQKLKIVAGAGKDASGDAILENAPAKEKKIVKKEQKKDVQKDAGRKQDKLPPAEEDDLFSEIKSPEEAAAAPATQTTTPAAADNAATETKTPAADAATDLLGEENAADKYDKMELTADGKTKVTLVKDTDLDSIAKNYRTTVEQLRKENSSLPASGKLKAGTVIIVSNPL